MTAAPRPNRPPQAVADRLIDTARGARRCLDTVRAASVGSLDRMSALSHLRSSVEVLRGAVDRILARGQAIPREVIVELRSCELALPHLNRTAVATEIDP